MLSPTQFRELVSGRRHGLGASLTRGALRVVEVPYSLVVRFRNHRYNVGRTSVHHVNAPVICVGNITLGGTGKTPMVKWLARKLENLGARVAIVSRGYGAAAGEQNDEARELAEALPNVPHLQNRDRSAAARKVIEKFDPSVILLDDGFRHRRLARDLDIVLLDALEPFGFEHVFPRGTLREPLGGLARADVICLSRADTLSAADREAIRSRVAKLAPKAAWCECAHAASHLVNASGERRPLDSLAGQRIAAFCAIGNPSGFVRTLTALKHKDLSTREFDDHHIYTADELADVGKNAAAWGAHAIVCTQKDLVKVQQDRLGDLPLWAIAIEMQFLSGQEALETLVESVVRKG